MTAVGVIRVLSVLALSATLAFVAAGCGGASAEEKWAGNVCTNIGDWKSELQTSVNGVRDKLQSPGAGTLSAINADVQNAVDATNKLASDLKATGPPDTEGGAQAKQQLNALASQLKTAVANAKQTLAGLPEGASLSETAQKLAPLAPALQSLTTSASKTIDSIKATSSKLKEGFDKADSCKQFR
jgi:hypothetical protein